MLAINAKRGVESTLERVFTNAGGHFDSLKFVWSGSTAGIIFEKYGQNVTATIKFPTIDEASDIPRSKFNNLIGYALHELGHAWFTDNEPWDTARKAHGGFVANLINGLEDPRIERKVVESGYAPNSRALFEDLVNAVLLKGGYVDATSIKDVPFLLAIEGRRLNGYQINVPSIVDDAPWAEHLHWALGQASVAINTQQIVDVALELYKRLQKDEESEGGDSEDDDTDGGGDPTDGDGDPIDGEGDPTDGDGDPTDQPTKGRGKGDFEGGRDSEPAKFIEDEFGSELETDQNIPNILKPTFVKFTWS